MRTLTSNFVICVALFAPNFPFLFYANENWTEPDWRDDEQLFFQVNRTGLKVATIREIESVRLFLSQWRQRRRRATAPRFASTPCLLFRLSSGICAGNGWIWIANESALFHKPTHSCQWSNPEQLASWSAVKWYVAASYLSLFNSNRLSTNCHLGRAGSTLIRSGLHETVDLKSDYSSRRVLTFNQKLNSFFLSFFLLV